MEQNIPNKYSQLIFYKRAKTISDGKVFSTNDAGYMDIHRKQISLDKNLQLSQKLILSGS